MSSVLSRMPISSGSMDKLFRLFAASQSSISTFVALVFVCLSAWLSGQIIWRFYGDQAVVTQWSPVQAGSASAQNRSDNYDVSALLEAALFGQFSEQAKPIETTPVVQDAPQTRLNLVLVGAVSSSTPQKSLAIIANRGKQATYGIGEQIEGTRAKLKSVFVDRVIIDNAGRDETLMLEGIKYKKSIPSQGSASRNEPARQAERDSSAAVAGQIDSIRAEIQQDSQKIFQYIGFSQAKRNGKIIGYRVRPGRNRGLFDAVGLKNGDVATALNGEDLTDPAVMGKIFTSISEMTELSLTVERDGQTHDIYIAL